MWTSRATNGLLAENRKNSESSWQPNTRSSTTWPSFLTQSCAALARDWISRRASSNTGAFELPGLGPAVAEPDGTSGWRQLANRLAEIYVRGWRYCDDRSVQAGRVVLSNAFPAVLQRTMDDKLVYQRIRNRGYSALPVA